MDPYLHDYFLEQAEAAYQRSIQDLESEDWLHVDTQLDLLAFQKKEAEGTDVLKIEMFSPHSPLVMARYLFDNSEELTKKSGLELDFCKILYKTTDTILIHSRFELSSIMAYRETVVFMVFLELDDGAACLTGCSVDYPVEEISVDSVRADVKNILYLLEPSANGGSTIKFLSKTDLSGSVPDSLVNALLTSGVSTIANVINITNASLSGL